MKRFQGVIIGLLIGVMLTGSVAIASTQKLDATFKNIKIIVDGTQVTPTDADGNIVEPFIVNGTTYLPIRAVAQALGKEVYWDGPNFTVYLGSMGGQLEYPSLRLEDATSIGRRLAEVQSPTDNYGNTYITAYRIASNGWDSHGAYQTLLNMKYSSFKGTFFVPQGTTGNGTTSFRIEIDGKIVYSSPEISKTTAPILVEIDVTGGNDFKIITADDYGAPKITFGDCGFYQ